MSARWDAIVIGAGVMGAAAIDALARRGKRVLGLERFEVPNARGSSHGGTRVIRMAYFEGAEFLPLLERSWRAWEELASWRRAPLLVRTGVLHFGPEARVRPVVECARAAALPHEPLDAASISARWPAFRPGEGDTGIYEDAGGVLRAERCVSALVERAIEHGASVRGHQRVVAVDVSARECVVRTDDEEHRAERVVLALGAWSEGDASLVPNALPLVVERQAQLWFAPRAPELVSPERMPVFLRFADDGVFYGLPRVELPGVKVCEHGGGELARAESLDRSFRASDEARVRAFVREHLPAADGPLLAARICMSTRTPDESFVVGPHPSEPARVVLACGFSGHGFKLAPAVGELIADHVDGSRTAALPLFDPARFAAR